MTFPALYHYFRTPLPYAQTLALQERIHQLQLLHPGRRQTEESVQDERARLTNIGADFVTTARGGELTFHGPGQIVGYPLIDLSRSSPPISVRDYVCRVQKALEQHLLEAHGIKHAPSDHTGVFVDANTKIASIGVQVRHRLTTHGFAMNITREPIPWFDQVVACGLADVKAGAVETVKNKEMDIHAEIPGLVARFGQMLEREFVPMNVAEEGEIGEAIAIAEEDALKAGDWANAPQL
ncbi:putative lipoyltransferase 2, mitochondrial [Mycena venus]|uniref:lipoyl(octanoyl) transferase n=1 Tax=Mycena venus TaxID=2733690 RepID=A0A8H6Y740_9AGAR|nr:putative lipoyltransferase 2, mitochondrial [Mycena venus]